MDKTKIKFKIKNTSTSNHIPVLEMVDLFSGTGAFSYVFHSTNRFKTIFANDILESSEQIFRLNNNDSFIRADINDVTNEQIAENIKFDLLTAGFPCQPFSIAGEQKGFDDERSNVFWKIISILDHHKPNIVILENVKNLQSHDNGKTFEIIISSLKEIGYYIKYDIINTCKVTGVPQNRERIYIVCFRDEKMYEKFNFDFQEIPNNNIINYLDDNVNDKYYYKNTLKVYDEISKSVTKHINTNTLYQYRRYYTRENKNSVCPTLTANMGSGGHNVPLLLDDRGIRKLTPRECFNLQGFPKDYKLPSVSDSKLYSLAGNAVSIPVISLIAKKIISIM